MVAVFDCCRQVRYVCTFLPCSAQTYFTQAPLFNGQIPLPSVVGYSTQGIAGGKLNCVSFQFSDIGAEDVASIAKLATSGLTPGQYDTMETDAPCIMVYDGAGGYDYYYYISDAYDTDGNEVTGWANFSGDIADNTEALGTGFWLRIPEATCEIGSLTESGEVNTADTATIDVAAGLTLAGNPYPIALDLSKVTTTGITAGAYDTMETEAPCLMIYDGAGGYDYYYYISDAYDADGNEVTAWANFSGDAAVGPIADVGTGFWIRSATAGKLTFTTK